MHIVVLADAIDNQSAGIHYFAASLATHLPKLDKNNKYTFIHCQENDFFKDKNHHIVPKYRGPGTDTLRKFHRIPKLIKKLNPDIVVETCHIGPFNLPAHIKRVTCIHDLTPILFPNYHIRRSTIIHRLLMKKIAKDADLIITPSETTANDIKALYKAKNITNIPLSVKPPTQTTTKSPKIPSQPYILYLGTIEPRKDLKTLIGAFNELKKDNKIKHKLVIAGEIGWKSQNIQKYASKNVIFTGFVDEETKSQLLQNADIFVYPSIYEGFGLPPLEALSYGIPTICTNGGSLKEIFEDQVLFFPPKNKGKLQKQILALTSSPTLYKNLSKKGKIFAQKFSWKKTCKEFIKALNSLHTQTRQPIDKFDKIP